MEDSAHQVHFEFYSAVKLILILDELSGFPFPPITFSLYVLCIFVLRCGTGHL